jgi:hypothetical protein
MLIRSSLPVRIDIFFQDVAILALKLRALADPQRAVRLRDTGMTADFGIAVNAEVFSLTHPEVYHAFLLSTPVC